MPQEVPYKVYKFMTGGNPTYQVLPGTNVPYGATEANLNEAKTWFQSNPDRYQQQKSTYSQLDQILGGQQVSSGLSWGQDPVSGQMGWGNWGQINAEQAANEAAVAAGTMKKVPIGSGFGYVPTGSAAASLQQGISSGQVSATGGGQQQGQFLQGQGFQPTMPTQGGTQTQFGQSTYTGPSIVDYLSSKGQNTSFSSRRQLAQQFGIQNYTGTPEQNTQLLNILRSQGQQQAGTTPPPGGAPTGAPPIAGAPVTGTPPPTGAVPPPVQGAQSATQYQNLLSMTGNLQTGARGTEVQQLQQFLQSQGFNVGAIDGIFGLKTQQALRQFQQSEGIAPDAIVGPITRSKIQAKLNASQVESLDQGEAQGEPPLSEAETDYSNYLQQQSYDTIYNNLSTQLGLPDVKNQLTEFQNKLKDVRDKLIAKKESISNNPWTSESQRLRKLKSAEASFAAEEANALEAYKEVQKIYDNVIQEIQFRAKLHVEQQNKNREFFYKVQQDAAKAAGIDTQVISAGGRRLLINKQTGATIKDLGSSTSTLNVTGAGFSGTGGTTTGGASNVDTSSFDANDWDWYLEQLILSGQM